MAIEVTPLLQMIVGTGSLSSSLPVFGSTSPSTLSGTKPGETMVPAGLLPWASGKPLLGTLNPFQKVSVLDLEIERLQASLKANGADTDAVLKRITVLEDAKKHEAAAGKLSIRKKEVAGLVDEARRKIVTGAMSGNDAAYQNGLRLLETLKAYEEAERKLLAFRAWAVALYPKDSPEVFRLDVDGRVESKDQPSNAYFENSSVMKADRLLRDSGDADDFEAHLAAERAFEFCKDADWATAKPAPAGALGQCDDIGIKDVKTMTAELEDLFQNVDLQAFMGKVEALENEKLDQNDGFKTGRDLKESLGAFKNFEVLLAAFEAYEATGLKGLTPDKMAGAKAFLVRRVDAYRSFLEGEKKRLTEEAKKSDPYEACNKPGVCSGTSMYGELWEPVDQVSKKIQDLDAQWAQFRKLDVGGIQTSAQLKHGFDVLKKAAGDASALEERHIREIYKMVLSQLQKMPSDRKEDLAKLEGDLAKIEASKTPGMGERLQAYAALSTRLDAAALMCTVDARVRMYEEYVNELDRADDLLVPGKLAVKVADVFSDNAVSSRYTFEVEELPDAKAVLAKYRRIKNQLESSDPAAKREGLAAMNRLELASVHRSLAAGYEKAAQMNGYLFGAGVVLASALTAGLAAELVAPLVAESSLGGAIVFGTNVSVFTISSHIYNALAYRKSIWDETVKMAKNPGDLVLETAMNALMFKYLGQAMQTYEKYFEKGLEAVARRNVAARLAEAAAKGEAKSSLLFEKAIGEEIASLRNSLGVKSSKLAGGFLYEGVKFQQWEFYVNAGRLAVAGDKNPGQNAAKAAFSAKAVAHSYLFLFSLKAGGVLSHPVAEGLTGALREATLGKGFDKPLVGVMSKVEGAGKDLDAYLETGKGDPVAILKVYEEALREQEAAIKKVPLGYRNEELIAMNQKAQAETAVLRRGLMALDHLLGHGKGNGLGLQQPEGKPYFVYPNEKRESLLVKLWSNPFVEPGSIEVLGGGVVKARFVDAFGETQTLFFKPDQVSAPAKAVPAKPQVMKLEVAY